MIEQKGVDISHAVVIEKCTLDSFVLKNSYPADPVITIPLVRQTFFQEHIRSNAHEFGHAVDKVYVEQRFNAHSGANSIVWKTSPGDWFLRDEGYSLQFRIKNSLIAPNALQQSSRTTNSVENHVHNIMVSTATAQKTNRCSNKSVPNGRWYMENGRWKK